MLEYILKRVLFFIPTLFVITILTFALSVHSPGDPVEVMMNINAENAQDDNKIAKMAEYEKMREKLHLNLPVFYFSLSPLSEPDSIYKISKKLHRENLLRINDNHGNWQAVSNYYQSLIALEDKLIITKVVDTLADKLNLMKQALNDLYYRHEDEHIQQKIAFISQQAKVLNHQEINAAVDHLSASFKVLLSDETLWKCYVPALYWYGSENQYHVWLVGMLHGDFGISYYKQQPVIDLILDRIAPTFVFSLLSVIIAFLVSIPIGMNAAIHKGTLKEKSTTVILFVLYSLPGFWVATLLINYVANAEYLGWFPVKGLSDFEEGASAGEQLASCLHHMVLPLFCYVYSSFAFISRQMRGSMLQTLSQDYIRTAWAKGLSPRKVYWKHAIRNSLLPIITLIASIFPGLIAGSVVIEQLFTLPGLGMLAYEAQVIKDYPVIFTIMLFSAILTLIGYLVADILYALVDPRISFGKK
ncbi:MAG: ABC transporter permease [Flavobacteriales bacterium]